MVANRTWEIRPSGMKMGATGNVDKARACDLSRPLALPFGKNTENLRELSYENKQNKHETHVI